MNKHELNKNMLDQILKYAAEQKMDDMANDYPSDTDLDKTVSFSPGFEKRMNEIFKKSRKKSRAVRNRKILLRAGIAAVLFLAVSTTIVFSVDAIRVPLLNLFTEVGQESTTTHVVGDKANYDAFADQIHGLFLPTYIPVTYTVKTIKVAGQHYAVEYQNPKGEVIQMQKFADGDTLGLDNENVQVQEMTVNGEPATCYSKNEFNTLLFKYNKNLMLLTGHIPQETIVQIAQSMKYRN